MEPQRGITLTIDDEVVTDQAIVIHNGDRATAWAWNPDTVERIDDRVVVDEKDRPIPREPGNEIVASLLQVTEDGNKLTGLDSRTGQKSTWLIAAGKGCRGCG